VCTGEILQTQRRFDLNLSVGDYYRIIEMKTAALFGAASGLGAALNGAEPAVATALRTYGLKLGTAYQVYDDLLDLAGDEAAAGKTLGSDLRKGKLTLPILNLLQASENGQRESLTQVILSGSEDDLAVLGERARDTGALAAAARAGRQLIEDGLSQLEVLEPSPYREALASVGRRLDATMAQYAE
jgi:octaprenyl-diphosphate synthase